MIEASRLEMTEKMITSWSLIIGHRATAGGSILAMIPMLVPAAMRVILMAANSMTPDIRL